jgi:hypothetical protein
MNRFASWVMVCAGVLCLTGGVYAQEFSADIVTNTKDGSSKGKVYVSKDRIRMEMQSAITIARMDMKKAWMLMPQQKMYMEMPADAQNLSSAMEKVPGERSRTLIGTETIGGRQTEKYEVSYDYQGTAETIYIWLSKELHFPLKSSALDNSWSVEYTNVAEGPQKQELFELPGEYTKFDYGATAAEAAGN